MTDKAETAFIKKYTDNDSQAKAMKRDLDNLCNLIISQQNKEQREISPKELVRLRTAHRTLNSYPTQRQQIFAEKVIKEWKQLLRKCEKGEISLYRVDNAPSKEDKEEGESECRHQPSDHRHYNFTGTQIKLIEAALNDELFTKEDIKEFAVWYKEEKRDRIISTFETDFEDWLKQR